MTQRVDYDAPEDKRPEDLRASVRLMVQFLTGPEGQDFKAFRSALRERGLWHKERSAQMFAWMGISWDREGVRSGGFIPQLQQAPDDEALADLLYGRLREQNILLAKYTMEALDIDGGGRMHSIHELYRMITSYVYPGERITLPCFKAWIAWMAAAGRLRYVGIRWALSEAGERDVQSLKSLDTEEILEDLAELAEAGELDEPVVAPAAALVAPPAAEVPTAPAPEEEEEDLLEMMPPEPEPPSEAAIAAAEAAFLEEFDEPPPEPATPEPSTDANGVGLPAEGLSSGRPALRWALEDVVAETSRCWKLWEGWPRYNASTLGVSAPEWAGDDLLFELGVLATLVEGLEPQPSVFTFVAALREADGFRALRQEGGLTVVLDALGDPGGVPWALALTERLVAARRLHQRLADGEALMPQLKAAANGEAVLRLLHTRLLGPASREAPFWVLRELVSVGVLDAGTFGDVAAVPTHAVLRNGWRAGLLDHPEALTLEALIASSRKVAAAYGSEGGGGEALELLDQVLGLVRSCRGT